ncbi:fungal-specific transcription factor domain-containing protein [Phlebopus sp. FC_14]|nr:fungal-specific transcription factor domain-containing protein [Phlebopus sp. FC_14]
MKDQPPENLPPITATMADNIAYSSTPNTYIPATTYYSSSHGAGHVHVVAPQPRSEPPQRKRPKYTRSKTGCLTCRVKKIKCDETKPICNRCTHGQRDCTWPEGVPTRKKATPRKDNFDGRPSTAESSGLSETSTPPTRDSTPPQRPQNDYSLPPMVSRRHSEPFVPPLAPEHEPTRRQIYPPLHHPTQNSVLSMIPEMSTYPASQPRYDPTYPTATSSMHPALPRMVGPSHPPNHPLPIRPMSQHQHQPPSHQWTHPQMLPAMSHMEPFFHTPQERNLIRHYCDKSLSIIMAIPSENPIVAANLPLVLDRPPGTDTAAEALRMALLGVAAIHQSFLLSQTSVTQGAEDMFKTAHAYRMNSKQLLARACTTPEGAQSDAALAACISISLMDIFSGGRNWAKNMDLAKTLVNIRGGPSALLSRGSHLQSVSADQNARTRLLLEILAVYDIAGCISSGKEPTLLTPSSDWWSDDSEVSISYVEQVFGISRMFVPILARVITFVSRALHGANRITEIVEPGGENSNPDMISECHELYNLLETWVDHRENVPRRVHTGNLVYQKTAQILLLRDVLQVAATDRLVQSCSDTVLTLCLECTSSQMGVDLVWPAIIAASHVYGVERARVAELFRSFRLQCCYEIATSEHLVVQVWKRLDQESPGADWRSVMKDMQLSVLVL